MTSAIKEFAKNNGLVLIPSNYFLNDSLKIAKELIGSVIVTNIDDRLTAGRIVETEAYPSYDVASHAFGEKVTPRTLVQYKEGGYLYIYLIMGLHLMTSIVTSRKGIADVVFIRSIKPLLGMDVMRQRRGYWGSDDYHLTSGPGILSRALGVTKDVNGTIVNLPKSVVFILKDPRYKNTIKSGRRINLGLSKYPPKLAKSAVTKPWRFYETGLENSTRKSFYCASSNISKDSGSRVTGSRITATTSIRRDFGKSGCWVA